MLLGDKVSIENAKDWGDYKQKVGMLKGIRLIKEQLDSIYTNHAEVTNDGSPTFGQRGESGGGFVGVPGPEQSYTDDLEGGGGEEGIY